MKKTIISAAIALTCVAQAFAYVEETEVMTIHKADGTTVEYNVAEVDKVDFDKITTNYALYIKTAAGDVKKLTAIPTVFRVNPAEEGNPYVFGFSTVEAETPADAREGEYSVKVSVAPTVMNTSVDDISDAENCGVVVTVYKYVDGSVDKVWESQNYGSLSTYTNTKTKVVTFNLEATFEDGMEVFVEFEGGVTAADDLEAFNPPFVYVNQGQYFNADGVGYGLFDVESATLKTGQSYRGISGAHYFKFTLSNGETCELYVKESRIGETIDFATTTSYDYIFKYDNIQIYGVGAGQMEGVNGTITVVKNDDGSYVVDATVANQYKNTWGGGIGGSPEYVVINYTGTPN